jgi:ubiquinone/menaquinone biosynthesis C-methylase UbiE
MNVFQRFARLATVTVARQPWLWPLFRPPLRRMFDSIAPQWDANRSPDRTRAFEAALQDVPEAPRRAIDLGTGTGDGAFIIARRWRETDVLGLDLSERMVAEARAKTPPELTERVRFESADASRLPVAAASFDLVALNNMIPFLDELARVLAPGGHVVVAFSQGPRTPIYVPSQLLRAELERRGFEDVREIVAGAGTAVVARRGGARAVQRSLIRTL